MIRLERRHELTEAVWPWKVFSVGVLIMMMRRMQAPALWRRRLLCLTSLTSSRTFLVFTWSSADRRSSSAANLCVFVCWFVKATAESERRLWCSPCFYLTLSFRKGRRSPRPDFKQTSAKCRSRAAEAAGEGKTVNINVSYRVVLVLVTNVCIFKRYINICWSLF